MSGIGRYSDYGLETDAYLDAQGSGGLKFWILWALLLLPAVSGLVLLYRLGRGDEPPQTPSAEVDAAREENPLKGARLSDLIRPSPEPPPAPPPEPSLPAGLAARFEAVAAALRKGDHLAARKGALALLEEPTLPVAFIPRAERLAGEANVAWLLDPKPGEGKVEVTVSSGDTPGRLAGRCGVSTALLMRVNGLKDPRKLRLGQKLILPERPAFSWDAPEEERVVLRLGGRFFKSYRIVPGGQGNRLWIDTPKGREAVAFASVDELAEARLIWRR
ncbi:MAG: LysM domain-containing protein [Kiritimatiellia bacterium]|nr:LysM domain-containing protein [Kiritimatiellia bacterium]